MFYQKKKKEYSEVSESKLNINSDYYHIFQNELKNFFPEKNINNNIDTQKNNNLNNNIEFNSNIISSVKENINNIINNKEKVITTNNNIMVNSTFKNVELNDNDFFFINMFIQYLDKNNK